MRQSEIAALLGISGPTLIHWKQIGGWIRPADATSPFGGPARNAGLRARMEERAEGRHRLDEAERLLGALETGQARGAIAVEEAFALLRGAIERVQRRPPPVAAIEPDGTVRKRRPRGYGRRR